MNPVPKPAPNRKFVKFCNSLRCPLCDAQLDGNITHKGASLYCSVNNDEYKVEYKYSRNTIFGSPKVENIKYYYNDSAYEISIADSNSGYQHTIYKFDLLKSSYYRDRDKKMVFSYFGDKLTFFRKRMEETEFLNKLKTYQVFA